MKLSGKFVKSQLALLKPLRNESSIASARRGQDVLGRLMHHVSKKRIKTDNIRRARARMVGKPYFLPTQDPTRKAPKDKISS
jgi:hypothetical protein